MICICVRRALLTVLDCLDLCCLPDWLVDILTALRVQQVRRKECVDERRLAQTTLALSMKVEHHHPQNRHWHQRDLRRP